MHRRVETTQTPYSTFGRCLSTPGETGWLPAPVIHHPISYNSLSTATLLHPLPLPSAPFRIMDTNSGSAEGSLDPGGSDRSPGNPNSPAPPAPDKTIGTQRPQTRVFTLFNRLPAELRVLIWEFACAPPGPRIHFWDPSADPDEVHWYGRDDSISVMKLSSRTHWSVTERTYDPLFEWYGLQLLSVCAEARRVFIRAKTTSLVWNPAHYLAALSDMEQTTDVLCIRGGRGMHSSPLPDPDLDEEDCYPRERHPPRRLALEIPPPADSRYCGWLVQPMSTWVVYYGETLAFMKFDRLEIVYLLDPHIKPKSHYDRHQAMPPEMYTETFDGHRGSKFVAIDPEDKQAVLLWDIPKHCGTMLECVRLFLTGFLNLQRISDPPLPDPKLRFLACVSESSQT